MPVSVIIPPSFHYTVVLPSITDLATLNRIRMHYLYAFWFVQFLFNELRYKDGSIHSPKDYHFYKGELMELKVYLSDLADLEVLLRSSGQ